MVGVLASSEVDRVFESRSGQTNDYANWYLLFTGWLEIMIMCPSGHHVHPRTVVYWLARNHDNVSEWASCLSTDCCFSEVFVVY